MIEAREPQAVYITGASLGLGAALAEAYAAPGVFLALCARNPAPLDAVAQHCRDRGAHVLAMAADVADPPSLAAWAEAAMARRPPDLVIANAGIFAGTRRDGRMESAEEARAQIRVNLEGAINTVAALLPTMVQEGRGRIVLIASLAAMHPLADAPAYSASKAGLAAYGLALNEALNGRGVRVSVVLPGHIRTRQTAVHIGLKPLEMAAEEAAAIVKRGIERGARRIVFPRRLALLASLASVLPAPLRYRLGRPFRFRVGEP